MRGQVQARYAGAECFPLLFASLTGRSGRGLARMSQIRSPTRSASQSSRASERTLWRSASSCSARTRPKSWRVRSTRPMTPGSSV